MQWPKNNRSFFFFMLIAQSGQLGSAVLQAFFWGVQTDGGSIIFNSWLQWLLGDCHPSNQGGWRQARAHEQGLRPGLKRAHVTSIHSLQMRALSYGHTWFQKEPEISPWLNNYLSAKILLPWVCSEISGSFHHIIHRKVLNTQEAGAQHLLISPAFLIKRVSMWGCGGDQHYSISLFQNSSKGTLLCCWWECIVSTIGNSMEVP